MVRSLIDALKRVSFLAKRREMPYEARAINGLLKAFLAP
jgi:hypothetical protein